MRSIEATLLVDFLRRGATIIPAMLMVMIGMPMWILVSLGRGAIDPTTREAVVLHVALTLMMGFLAAVAVFQSHGQIARFFVRPVSATRLVTCQMLFAMVTVALMYIASASLFNLFGAGWPLIGPAMFLVTTIACALAMVWWFEGSPLIQFIGCLITTFPLVVWFNRCYGATVMGDWQAMWQNSTAGEMLTLAAISGCAYVVAVVGVQRQRRGDRWDFAAVIAWWERLRAARNYTPARFTTPQSAQLWSEWRSKLAAAPAMGIACFMVFMLALRNFGFVEMNTMLEVMCMLPLIVLTFLVPLAFGLVLGECNHSHNRTQMRHLLATRPVTDSFFAGVILRNAIFVLLSSWTTWVILFSITAGVTFLLGYREEVIRAPIAELFESPSKILLLVVLPLISWTMISIMATLSATGRPWLWGAILTVSFGLGIVFAVVNNYISPALFEILYTVWFILVGGLALAGTLFLYFIAIRKKLISPNAALLPAAAWVIASLISCVAVWHLPQAPILIWHSMGLLSLSILPFAGLPLAIRWNRHR